ncbi:MAG TPA: alginate lyase family protein [Anaerolineales bacterium]|nr:alginate lyase family protein [Anaerolineales bacterium]
MPSLLTSLKALIQLGPEPLLLYALYELGLRTGRYRRVEKKAGESKPKAGALKPLLALPRRDDILKVAGQKGAATLLQEADEIVAGNVRSFGGEPAPLHLTFDRPLQHWSEYETGRASIPYPPGAIHDVKFVWEPGRFAWALKLGRAYQISGDDKYAETFWGYLEEFNRGNPTYLGPHWMNGQEVALRLMALLWAVQLFESAAASNAERKRRLVTAIAEHARRIAPTLVYARSQNNNHLVTESAALFAAGTALGESKWRAIGWRWLNHALQRQISSYGEYIQHSTNYHRVMLQAALWADAIVRRQGEHWPPETLEALMRASHWMFSMIDPISGRTPNLGANDGALILPLDSSSFHDFRPTVQAAARAFLRTCLPAGEWDELSLWLGLAPRGQTADSDAYMAEHLRGKSSWGYLRASRFRSRLSHMDQLHFDLWKDGRNIARDAGTFRYNAETPWNNSLVSTSVHNTITVDGLDQMQRGGRFLVLDWFPAYSKSVLEVDEKILGRMMAYHNGYRPLGIRHERIATVYADERWEIRDNLVFLKPGEHVFRLHWLLEDGEWQVENRQSRTETRETKLELRVKAGSGVFCLKLTPDPRVGSSDVRVALVRAGECLYGTGQALPFAGWISPTYGVKEPGLSLAMEITALRSFSIVSEFVFDGALAENADARS